jgi:hypothetical protein
MIGEGDYDPMQKLVQASFNMEFIAGRVTGGNKK